LIIDYAISYGHKSRFDHGISTGLVPLQSRPWHINLLQTEELFKSQNYQFEPLNLEIFKTTSEINDIPELHDRLIVATARHLGLPLITNDPVIRNSKFVEVLE